MNYEEVLDYLKLLEENDDNRLEDSVTVWDMEMGEYYPAEILEIRDSDGILDDGHIMFGFNQEGGDELNH